MGNQVEKHMEHDMETGCIYGLNKGVSVYGPTCLPISFRALLKVKNAIMTKQNTGLI